MNLNPRAIRKAKTPVASRMRHISYISIRGWIPVSFGKELDEFQMPRHTSLALIDALMLAQVFTDTE
ncbi:hypothetical protein BgiBS90_002928, partial [Biomphalaria glabrata]